jgi:hypothetical protein
MSNEELKQYYKDLLIVQYSDKPKAMETIKELSGLVFPVNSASGNLLLDDIKNAFNLDTAEGVQLDTIGGYVGVDRFYTGNLYDSLDLFGFIDYNNNGSDFGFNDYSTFDSDQSDGMLTYDKLISLNNKLDDDNYRFLIKLKILQNTSDHTNKSIDDGLFSFFENDLFMVDNGDMSISYFLSPKYKTILQVAIQKNIIPKPMGVKIKNFIKQNTYFGCYNYDMETVPSWLVGFSDYSNFETKEGKVLTYNDIEV